MTLVLTNLPFHRYKFISYSLSPHRYKAILNYDSFSKRHLISKSFLQKSEKRSLVNISVHEPDMLMLKIAPISGLSKVQFRSQSTSGTSLPSLLNKMLKPNQVKNSNYNPMSDREKDCHIFSK